MITRRVKSSDALLMPHVALEKAGMRRTKGLKREEGKRVKGRKHTGC
jgi:hypothetical protein